MRGGRRQPVLAQGSGNQEVTGGLGRVWRGQKPGDRELRSAWDRDRKHWQNLEMALGGEVRWERMTFTGDAFPASQPRGGEGCLWARQVLESQGTSTEASGRQG